MPAATAQHYQDLLREMRDRMLGQINSTVEAIREDLQPAGGVSNAPVHLADAAPENIESDIEIIESERGVVEEIQAALRRIENGTFGVCESCGRPVGEERLRALPYAARCITCAN